MTAQRIAYIGTGEKCGFYTLRRVFMNEEHFSDQYVRNLSTDWDKAFTKAKEWAKRTKMRLEVSPFELTEFGKLRGEDRWNFILELVDPDIIPIGKFHGQSLKAILEENLRYFWWMVYDFDFRKTEHIPFRVYLATLLADHEDPVVRRAREKAEREEQERIRKESADPVPVTDKRVKIVGEVLATKEVESYYGYTTKMLVLDDRGFKVWGTAAQVETEQKNQWGTLETVKNCVGKGDRIEFMARVEPSKDDDKFGFFKRPTKAALVK